MRRLRRIGRILASPYRSLLRDDQLEVRLWQHRLAPLNTMEEDGDWRCFEVGGLRVFWPLEYEARELRSLYHETFAPSSYNPHAFEFGKVRIRPGDWVVDAGACEGFFAQYAVGHGANVLIVEPVPLLVEALSRTFEAEIQVGRVRIVAGGISETSGVSKLTTRPDKVYSSTVGAEGSETVAIHALDDLVEQGIVPTIDFVKMDIEGHEVAAMRGMSKLLRTHRPRLSIAVYHREENARLIKRLLDEIEPRYQVRWRGVWARGDDSPRPYMLYASAE